MTAKERHWLTSESPASLLYHAEQLKALKPRKRLLFACGCYRLIWDRITLPSVREVVEKAEGKADRKVSQQELAKCRPYTPGLATYHPQNLLQLSLSSLVTPKMIPTHIAWLVRAAFDPVKHDRADKWENDKPQADLVRDVLGNPYRPPRFEKSWRTHTAVALADQMYESRDFGAMPILADSLQEAGCDSEDILSHARDPEQVHVRGCWVVDLVLGNV
jgi:hypothetical protein